MTREEFEAHVAKVLPEGKTAPEPTDAEYKLIEYVYNFHPAISATDGKEQIAELYVKFGMCLINDMKQRATLMEQKERELREAMAALNKVKEEIEEIQRGGMPDGSSEN